MRTIGQFLSLWTSRLDRQGVDAPRLSAELLTASALGWGRLDLLINQQRILEPPEVRRAEGLLHRRGTGEPLAYILGEKEFYGLPFRVNNEVLIPRPETEQIIEVVKSYYACKDAFVFADVCTGSGVLGIVLATLFPRSRGVLMDISGPALEVAAENVRIHGMGQRLQLVRGDLSESLGAGRLDLLVANPPYIPLTDRSTLDREIREYEPHQALFGGATGTEEALRLTDQAWRVLTNGSRLILELGLGQAALLARIRNPIRWNEPRIVQDFSGRDRILILIKTVL